MAKNTVEIGVKVKDDGSVEKMALKSKNAAKGLDGLGKSANTADRNIKGAAQASANGTKNFSKMAQGAGGLVGVYATLAASAFAVSAAFQFLKSAMDFKNLLEGQKALGAVTGVAYKTISDSLVEATNGQLRYAEAAKAAAIGTASGISPDQLARLGSAAKNASIALGRDLGDSFDRLIRGVTKAEPELLDELGIILRLENATRKYGLEIGKSKDELNEFERSQAVANEVLSQAERKFGAMEKMMDPTAHSLNQFAKAFDDLLNKIKTGVATVIGPIASFLADNMMALSGAVALFAGSLLKQVLPSMTAFRESSIATATQVKRDQKAIQLRLERTKRSYEKLKLAQMDSHAVAKGTSSKIVSGMSGGTKSGEGALDFFAGTTDSKKSRAAAKKAIDHANQQIEAGVEKRTGLLKNASAQQVKDLQESYNVRSVIHKKGTTDFKFNLKQGGFAIKSFKLQLTSMGATTKIVFADMAAAAAKAGALIGKAFFWLSLLSIAYDGFKLLKERIFPTSEETKKLAKETEELASTYKTLAEELSRTNKVMEDFTMLGSSERIKALGKALGSANISGRIKEINDMIEKYPNRTIPIDAFKDLIAGTDEIGKLDSRFKVLSDSLNSGTKITKAQGEALVQLANDFQNSGIIMERFAMKVERINSEMVKLVGNIKKPYGTDLRAALVAGVSDGEINIKSLKKELKLREKALEAFEKENEISRKGTSIKNKKVQSDIPLSEGQDPSTNLVNLIFGVKPEILQDHKDLKDRLQEERKILEDLIVDTAIRRKFNSALEKSQTKLNELSKASTDAAREASEMRTNGVTIQDKLTNIEADNLRIMQSTNDEQQALIVLRDQEKSLTDENGVALRNISTANAIILNSTRQQILLGEEKLQQAKNDRTLALEKNNILRVDLEQQKTINKQIRERLKLTNAIVSSSLLLKNIQAGGTGLFGAARSRAASLQGYNILKDRRTDANQNVTDTESILNAEKAKVGSEGYDKMKVFNAAKANEAAKNNLNNIQQEIDLYEKRADIAMLNVRADTEAARLKVESISMNPAMTAFNTKMNELYAQGVDLNTMQIAQLYEEIEAQTLLATLAEQKQALFEGISSSLSSAFTSIVTGTASAKEAFKNMAISILSQISQMIVQMMVMRMLMSFFAGPMQAPTSAIKDPGMVSQINYTDYSPFARTGGVFSNGKTMQGYATGGIARGSTSGYPAVLHGTEAVVPLPNGRSIPVEMKDSGATNNNIVVNVSTDGQTNKQGSTGPDMDKLGSAIAAAVQTELQNQKRSGGILNPYGVA